MLLASSGLVAVTACGDGMVDPGGGPMPDASAGAVEVDAAASPHGGIIYLQGAGGVTYHGGDVTDSVANTSPMLGADWTPSASEFYPARWPDLTACVRGKLAPFDIQVTDQDPGAVDHIEVVVTADRGADNGFGVSTFAGPVVCAPEPRPVIFAYPLYNDEDVEFRCDTIAYALGISIGLSSVQQDADHQRPDGMNFGLVGRNACFGDVSFRDADLTCGEEWQSDGPCSFAIQDEGPCRCGGTTQNSYARMAEVFGLAR